MYADKSDSHRFALNDSEIDKFHPELMEANANQNKPPQSFTYFDNFRGLSFLNDLFKAHPDLFETPTKIDKHGDACGGFVFYLLYSGQMVKASALFDEFAVYMRNSNPKIIQTIMTKPQDIYSVQGLNIITWAKYLRETGTFCVYEPVLKLNDIVLQTFLQTKKVIWNDKTYNLEDIRPIAFTNIGENITDLIPYICYLYNFFSITVLLWLEIILLSFLKPL